MKDSADPGSIPGASTICHLDDYHLVSAEPLRKHTRDRGATPQDGNPLFPGINPAGGKRYVDSSRTQTKGCRSRHLP